MPSMDPGNARGGHSIPSWLGYSVPDSCCRKLSTYVNFNLTYHKCQCKIYSVGEFPKFVFGTSIKQQVAARITAYIAARFDSNSAKAADDLGISRQRLFSYTSAKTLPRPPMFDLILEKWGLNLLGKKPRGISIFSRELTKDFRPEQTSLFDSPVTLKSDELRVVIKRKGPRLVASIEISADVEIA
jgi:hypothetical protein